jgi:hypothetical protein
MLYGMRFGSVLLFGACITSGLVLTVACTTDYQLGTSDPAYGAPNALENQRPPRPTLEGATADGGTSASSSGASTPACVKAGGKLVEAGACPVSFKTDILKIFGTAAAPSVACTSTDCHGGKTPNAQPAIEPGTPEDTYNGFQAFTAGGKPYVSPCETDPAKTSILCNVQAAACGSHMPKGGGQINAADLKKIEDWVKCGAPNN